MDAALRPRYVRGRVLSGAVGRFLRRNGLDQNDCSEAAQHDAQQLPES